MLNGCSDYDPPMSNRYHVPAVARSFAVLELLATSTEPRGLSTIARDLDIPKSSCFTILSTLPAIGFAHRDD